MARRKRSHRVRSKAQWRWVFATKQPFAHKWAERRERGKGYKSLPRRKGVRKR